MRNPHPLIAALVLAVILAGLALTLVQALRNGEFGSRGRMYIVRRKNPIQFWMGIVVCCVFLAAGFGQLANLMWQMLSRP